MEFKKVDVKTLDMKPFEKIGSEWMLISAAKDGKANTMTASWGGIGVLWGKNVATVYIRPQRHTKEFVDAGDTFTISFFGGEHMKELGYLGKVSGKDVPDKIEQSGLHLTEIDGQPGSEELHRCWYAESFTMTRSNRKTSMKRKKMKDGIRKKIIIPCTSLRSGSAG